MNSDIMEMDGKIVGYLEFKTRSHKTARLVQRQGLSMPLVAPAWGVGSTPWAIEFAKVAKLAARPLESLHNTPLLAAPTTDGDWTNRSTSTVEAKRWLLCLLKKSLGRDPEATTIHCLKSTALSWAGKAGLGTFHRARPVFLYGVLWVGWVGGSPGAVVIANLFVATRLVSWIA